MINSCWKIVSSCTLWCYKANCVGCMSFPVYFSLADSTNWLSTVDRLILRFYMNMRLPTTPMPGISSYTECRTLSTTVPSVSL